MTMQTSDAALARVICKRIGRLAGGEVTVNAALAQVLRHLRDAREPKTSDDKAFFLARVQQQQLNRADGVAVEAIANALNTHGLRADDSTAKRPAIRAALFAAADSIA